MSEPSPEAPVAAGDVAIVGMACLFPGAEGPEQYWRNIVSGVDAVTEHPADRWDTGTFLDPQSTSPARLYCTRGGYLGELARCNPAKYGIMPLILNAGEPDQVLSLRVAHEALADAGYAERPFNRDRTEIVLGRGNYSSAGFLNLAMHTVLLEQTVQTVKNLVPGMSAEALDGIRQELRASLPPLGPDTAGAVIPNLTTGRVANRLDLMGANFTVDAACASALIAVDLAARDLRSGRCDVALAGGVHMATHVPFLSVFTQLGALSRASQIRPFDERADGMVAGEGVGIVVLKRRADAEADGDRIYALIKAVGTASDGRGHGLLAPRVEGEELAMRRAYEAAGFGPETVELIEAHGTATPVGDHAEIEALRRLFGPRRGVVRTCGVGSVKSMIGHLMPAAGIAGLIKATLALHHRVLPPTLHCETPNPKFELESTPLYINTEARPWVHGDRTPRRAGVSAFGFGGINAHVILEEFPAQPADEPGGAVPWETELCLLQGDSRGALIERGRWLQRVLAARPDMALEDLACSLNGEIRPGTVRLAIVASSMADLQAKLGRALGRLESDACRQIKDSSGVYFFAESLLAQGKLAFIFPGEASQYPNMLRDLSLHFPKVRAAFDLADRAFLDQARPLRPSQSVFPVPTASDQERATVERRLWEMGGALEAILTSNWALFGLLRDLEIRPDFVLGHSSGEYSALTAAGMLTPDDAFMKRLVALSADLMRRDEDGQLPDAVLVAAGADRAAVEPVLRECGQDVFLAMDNCPHQVVLVGQREAMDRVVEALRSIGVVCQRLPFDRAYHTPLFRAISGPIREALAGVYVAPREMEIYSSATMAPYPAGTDEIRTLMADLLSMPVRFQETVDALYSDEARVFLEVGARGNLTAFVDDILRGRPHLAIPCDVPRRNGLTQLNHALGLLAAQGVGMRLDALYARRARRALALDAEPSSPDAARSASQDLPVSMNLPDMRVRPRPAPPRAEPHGQNGHAARPEQREGEVRAPGLPERLVGDEAAVIRGLRLPSPMEGGAIAGSTPGEPAAVVVEEHLRTMEHFLAVQQDVMEAFLGASQPAPSAPASPLLGSVVSLEPGRQVVTRRVIDPAEDLYLDDHALGGRVISDVDATLRPTPIVPFTVCMEMMAETAALLAPGDVLTGMRKVEVRRWLLISRPTTVEITARRSPEGAVTVEVRTPAGGAVVASGTALFAPSRAPSPAAPPRLRDDGGPCRYKVEQMYAERMMFHGPRFQGVTALDRSGPSGLSGRLTVLPRTDLLASTAAPELLTDPVLLDSAGQLNGYWARERLGATVFPFRLGGLELHGDLPAVGESLRCEVDVHEATARQVRSTLSLFDAADRLRARLVDWETWRFYPTPEIHDCLRFPSRHLLSHAWLLPLSRLAPVPRFACQRIEASPETVRIIADIVPQLLLSRAERQQWEALSGPETRRAEWILGRAVAKDAVRVLLKRLDGRDRFPADIEIDQDARGRPIVKVRGVDPLPVVSIAHREGMVVALAGFAPEGRLGIDLEHIRERAEGFLEIAFDAEERQRLAELPEGQRDEWITRLWCAKEAAAKALGHGLVDGPRSLAVRRIDPVDGGITLVLGVGLGREFPELAEVELVAHTAREGDWVVATSLCERSASR